MDVFAYTSAVPEMPRFLTVDELHQDLESLADRFPEIVRRRRVGTSRLGEPLHLVSIGHGTKNAFLFGCPHPNEPIGAMTVHHLAHVLTDNASLRDELDYTWHLIPCVDPDGTRLNEGWFAGPFTPSNYARHFFRPAMDQQVEWTFPIAYKRLYFDSTLRETEMLMRVIDELRPTLMVSLHNAGFGGVYYYVSRPAEPLYDTFHQLPESEGLPLNLGEPETPFMEPLHPAIFRMPTSRESYDYLETNGVDPTVRASGTSSHDYARQYGTFTLVIEMPYFDDPRINDLSQTETRRRDAILTGLDLREEAGQVLRDQLQAVSHELRGNSPFELSVRAFADYSRVMGQAERHWAQQSPETDRPATVAEVFSSNEHTQFYRLLNLGMLVRMLEGEVAIGNGTPAIREQLARARQTFDNWSSGLEGALSYRAIPIRKLVAVQLGAILASAAHLETEPGD